MVVTCLLGNSYVISQASSMQWRIFKNCSFRTLSCSFWKKAFLYFVSFGKSWGLLRALWETPVAVQGPWGRAGAAQGPSGRAGTAQGPLGTPVAAQDPLGRAGAAQGPSGRAGAAQGPLGTPVAAQDPLGTPV